MVTRRTTSAQCSPLSLLAVVLLMSAASYAYRLADGRVLTTLPGVGELLP